MNHIQNAFELSEKNYCTKLLCVNKTKRPTHNGSSDSTSCSPFCRMVQWQRWEPVDSLFASGPFRGLLSKHFIGVWLYFRRLWSFISCFWRARLLNRIGTHNRRENSSFSGEWFARDRYRFYYVLASLPKRSSTSSTVETRSTHPPQQGLSGCSSADRPPDLSAQDQQLCLCIWPARPTACFVERSLLRPGPPTLRGRTSPEISVCLFHREAT